MAQFPNTWQYLNSSFDRATGMRFAEVRLRNVFVVSIKWQDQSLDTAWQENHGLTPYTFHLALTPDERVTDRDMQWSHSDDILSIKARIGVPILQIHCHQQDDQLLYLLLKAQKDHRAINLDVIAYSLVPGPQVADMLEITDEEMIRIFKNSDELDMSNFRKTPKYYKIMYGPDSEACVSSHRITHFSFSTPPKQKGALSRLITAIF